jgi:O6-methylguanine-DNA--protein-cysteine methyltransferase
MIMSKNDSPKTLPCHRVVASNGKLTGYAFGGIEKKKELLEKEGVQFIGDKVLLEKSLWSPQF